MPRPLPASLAEALTDPTNTNPEATDVARVLGGIGLPTDREIGRIPSGNSPEVVFTSWELATEAHDSAKRLFSEIGSGLEVPDLSEFVQSGVDFAQLQAGYEAYETANMAPELVFAPINLPLTLWKTLYGGLRQWQDANDPSSGFKLKNQSDGDGLYVWPAVANNWDSLNQMAVTNTPGVGVDGGEGRVWKAIVVPTAPKPQGGLAVNTSHDLSKSSPQFTLQASTIGEASPTATRAHMPIGTYLTLQALHTLRSSQLLDTDTWTWNAGTFDESGSLRAPASDWNPANGRVRVNRGGVGYAVDYLGARLPVWGEIS